MTKISLKFGISSLVLSMLLIFSFILSFYLASASPGICNPDLPGGSKCLSAISVSGGVASSSSYNATYATWLPNYTASSKYWYNMTLNGVCLSNGTGCATTVSNSDGSLNISGTQISINTSNSNKWLVDQNFSNIYSVGNINTIGNVIINGGFGGLGIGTDSPQQFINVVGTFSLAQFNRDNNVIGYAATTFYPNGTVNASNAAWGSGLYANSNNFNIWSTDGVTDTNRISISNTGKVGINTNNPNASLAIGSGNPTGTQGVPANQWGLFVNSSYDVSFNGYTTLGGAVYITAQTLSFPLGYAEATNNENKLGLDKNALVIGNNANRHANYGHGNQVNPTLYVQSSTSPTDNSTQWISITRNNETSLINTGSGAITLNASNGWTQANNINANQYTGDGSNLSNLKVAASPFTYRKQGRWHTTSLVAAVTAAAIIGNVSVYTPIFIGNHDENLTGIGIQMGSGVGGNVTIAIYNSTDDGTDLPYALQVNATTFNSGVASQAFNVTTNVILKKNSLYWCRVISNSNPSVTCLSSTGISTILGSGTLVSTNLAGSYNASETFNQTAPSIVDTAILGFGGAGNTPTCVFRFG